MLSAKFQVQNWPFVFVTTFTSHSCAFQIIVHAFIPFILHSMDISEPYQLIQLLVSLQERFIASLQGNAQELESCLFEWERVESLLRSFKESGQLSQAVGRVALAVAMNIKTATLSAQILQQELDRDRDLLGEQLNQLCKGNGRFGKWISAETARLSDYFPVLRTRLASVACVRMRVFGYHCDIDPHPIVSFEVL